MHARKIKPFLKKLLIKIGLKKLTLTFYYFRLFKKNIIRIKITKKSFSNKLIKHLHGFHGQNIDLKTGNLGFGLFHYSFVMNSENKKVLCVGSEKGFVPGVCAVACHDSGEGHVDFVDAGYRDNNPNSWGGTAFWKKINPKKHFKKIGVEKYITTHVVTTKKFHNSKKRKEYYDYIYIDGDHSFRGVSNDYKMFWPWLKKDGLMSFHDVGIVENYKNQEFGVHKFWKNLKKDNKISFIRDFGGATIGFIQK